MTYYLDTSALAKRYVTEPGSVLVRALFRRQRPIVVSRIAYAELAAAVARQCREGVLPGAARDAILARLDRDLAQILVLDVRASTLGPVAGLVVRHPLRGFDAVHLASALALAARGGSVDFWSADRRLVVAARAEGLRATLVG
ncbi:MAG: type II toxin-antitoxin system VapC family toxin [Deltaproteobacteria bacterium]|nr:type II toxin-antitoxin system VapC family toxin [Deltaproteobacteria bacterium]